LPESVQNAGSKQQIIGSKLLEMFEPFGVNLSEFGIEPSRQYNLLPELSNSQGCQIGIDDLPKLLAHNHPAGEYQRRLQHYQTILQKLSSPSAVSSNPIVPQQPQISGRQLFDYFSASGEDISQYQLELNRQYSVPSELINGNNFSIQATDLPRLIAYNK
jgi:hypothetical protein